MLERAERVCAGDGIDERDVASLLGALVDKSMLVAQDGRFRQLETLREFGRAQLAASPGADAVRAAHTAVHTDLARAAARGFGGRDEATWMAEIEASFDDIREAHAAAVEVGDVDRALRIVIGVREYAWRRIRYEHLAWAEVTVAMPGAREHPLCPVVLGVVAYGLFVHGELDAAIEAAEHAVAEAARLNALTAGLAERTLANALFYRQRDAEAMVWMERMLEAARATGAPGIVAHAYYMRSVGQTSLGDPEGGTEIAALSAAAAIESGSPTALAQADYAPRCRWRPATPAGRWPSSTGASTTRKRSATAGSAPSRSPRAYGSGPNTATRATRSWGTATSSTPGSAGATGRTSG